MGATPDTSAIVNGHGDVNAPVVAVAMAIRGVDTTTPLDVAVSVNGRWVFVLTQQGSILIYSGDGKLEDEVSVGKHIDGIEVGPEEDILLLSSRKNKTVQILLLAFIQNFDISNSPFKGRVDAPVEIAVFSDFQ